MPNFPPTFWILLAAALVYGYMNGFHDSANVVATVIASRAIQPRVSLFLTAVAQAIAPFIFGVAVANTIGKGLAAPEDLSVPVVLSALVAAILWNLLTWWLGIPSSSSHALVGGLLGGIAMGAGLQAVRLGGLTKVLAALILSPVLGLIISFLFTRLVYFLAQWASPSINNWFRSWQVLTSLALALGHGSNDSQKTMGIIALGMVSTGVTRSFGVPVWVIAVSALAMSLGTYSGGWRLIRTLGGKIYKIRPVHGFSAQLSSAAIVFGAALVGGPVSTTQVVSAAIMGSGAAQRPNMVRWGVGMEMLIAWGLTIPLSALLSAGVYFLIRGCF